MFKLSTTIKQISLMHEALSPKILNHQSVRWRKPRWLPTAKSKMFRISPRIRLPLDESEELKRLYNNYRTQIKSINLYLTEKYSVENLVAFDKEQHQKAVEEDFTRCTALNTQWNNEIKICREERVRKQHEENIDLAQKRLQERKNIYVERFEKAEEIVRQEKDVSKDFITPEKLEDAIEYAINNPVDYNFSLDVEGTKIRGRDTKPVPVQDKIKTSG